MCWLCHFHWPISGVQVDPKYNHKGVHVTRSFAATNPHLPRSWKWSRFHFVPRAVSWRWELNRLFFFHVFLLLPLPIHPSSSTSSSCSSVSFLFLSLFPPPPPPIPYFFHSHSYSFSSFSSAFFLSIFLLLILWILLPPSIRSIIHAAIRSNVTVQLQQNIPEQKRN